MIRNAEDNDNVASFDSRFLVGFSSEADLLAVVHAFLDVNFQDFLCCKKRLRLPHLFCVFFFTFVDLSAVASSAFVFG